MKNIFIYIIIPALLVFSACAKEAPNVIPNPETIAASDADTGTDRLRILSVYPEDGAVDIPVDTPIVLVFNKAVDASSISVTPTPTTTITIQDTATMTIWVDAISVSRIADNKTALITLTGNNSAFSPDLPDNTQFTISVNSGVYEDLLPSSTMENTWSSTFTTSVFTATAPYVIPLTAYPTGTGINKNISYAEVSFSTTINASTVTTSSFTIAPNPGVSGITQVDGNTFRLNFSSTLAASTSYTLTLTSAIQDTDGEALIINADTTWGFTTVADPSTAAVVDSVWVDSTTTTTADIYFTTDGPFDYNNCRLIYSTSPSLAGPTTVVETDWDLDGLPGHTYHYIPLSSLAISQVYYFRIWIDTNTDGTLDDPGDLFSASIYSFATKSDNSVNVILANANGDQKAFKAVQFADGSSYIFWVDNDSGNDDIYGQYFDSGAANQWTAGGDPVGTHANSQSSIVAISDRYTDALVLYKDGNDLYGKLVYDNSGTPGFRWAGAPDTASQGVNLGITTFAGSIYSVVITHERPVVKTTGFAEMPKEGVPTNLLFDRDVDFSGIGFLNAGDLLLTNTSGINWTSDSIQALVFNYVLDGNGTTNLGAFSDYFIADTDALVTSGTADNVNTTTISLCRTLSLASVSTGDIILTDTLTNREWGLAVSAGTDMGGYWCVDIDRTLTNLNQGDDFEIYSNYSGPYTSEAVTNPLWDNDPTSLFNLGTNVQTNDIVINENNNSFAATTALVSPVTVADSDYAIQLDTDIMNNGDEYAILAVPSGSTYIAAGYSTSSAQDFELDDSNAAFLATVNAGDIVYNIDQDISTEIISVDSNTQLTLSADIFNSANDKYVIYRKRSFFTSYIDSSNYVMGGHFDLSTGLAIGGAVTIDSSSSFSKPMAVSDEAGSVMVFYQGGANVYGKSILADDGSINWSQTYTDLGTYSLVQVLPDGSSGGRGGAYVIGSTGFGSLRILRVNGTTGASAIIATLTGFTPNCIVDPVAGSPNRLIITYLGLYNDGFNDYFYVRAAAYNGDGSVSVAAYDVTGNSVSYNCFSPRVVLSDTGAGTSGYYISWYDGRYYSFAGYSVFAQQYNNSGTAQWASDVFISTSTSYGLSGELYMDLLYYNDGGAAPMGAMPVWLDLRNYSATDYDIYFEAVQDTGAY